MVQEGHWSVACAGCAPLMGCCFLRSSCTKATLLRLLAYGLCVFLISVCAVSRSHGYFLCLHDVVDMSGTGITTDGHARPSCKACSHAVMHAAGHAVSHPCVHAMRRPKRFACHTILLIISSSLWPNVIHACQQQDLFRQQWQLGQQPVGDTIEGKVPGSDRALRQIAVQPVILP